MTLFSLLLISISLSMDAFAVSVSAGCTFRKVVFRQAFLLALTFGVFQAMMPLIGWFAGSAVHDIIEVWSSWIAFILLGGIGINMIREALSDEEEGKRDYLSFMALLTLWVATSIDALAVGVSFALLPVDIIFAITIIGLVTFPLCLAWVYIGARFGHIFEKKAEIVGGIILIVMGMKIIGEHLFAPFV